MPVTLRGPVHWLTKNRPHASQTVADTNCDNLVLDNPVDKTMHSTANDDTEIVRLHRKSADECALMVLLGNRHSKALWDSGAGKCVMSFNCYQSIPTKYKPELYPRRIKIKAANGMFITNKGECDLTFVIGDERFTFPFLCSDQLYQQIILGHNFAKAFNIGTWWDQDDNMYLTRYDKPFEQIIPSSTINGLVVCTESIVIPPYSNGYIQCKVPKEKFKASLGKNCVFEPSYKHQSNYVNCTTYEGIVTLDDSVLSSDTFNIVMTNRFNKHIKVTRGHTMGMLKTCEEHQICTIHRVVTFEQKPVEEKEVNSEFQKVEESLCHIPTRNKKTGKIEVNTLLKKDLCPVTHVNELGSQHDFVNYSIPALQDTPIDKQTKAALDKLLDNTKDAFAEDERQIATIAKKPYTLALKHYDWVKEEIDKMLEAGVIRKNHSSWSAPIVVVPKGDGGKRLCVDFRALNKITRTYVWPMPRVGDIFAKLRKAKFYTTLDLQSGYHHIALDKDSIKKTAFVAPFGKYEYLKVPFGLAQAPAYFQNLMNKVLNGLNVTLAYLDDVIIFSENAEQHLKHIQIILTKLKQANLKLKKSRCAFFKK